LSSNRSSAAGKERDAIRDLRKSKSSLIQEKKVMQNNMAKLKKDTESLMNDRKAAKANVRFSSVEKIDEEIKKLQERQETTSMSLSEEKNLIKEIGTLQKSKDLVASFKQADLSIDDSKLQRKVISDQLRAKDKEIDLVQADIEVKQKVLDDMKSTQDVQRSVVDDMKKERETLKQDIGDKLKERNEVRDTFREANNKWYDYQRAVKAQRKMKYDEEKKQREDEEQQRKLEWEAEEAKKIPYEEEQELCTALADYLTRTYIAKEDDDKKDETAKNDFVPVVDDPFAGMKAFKKGGDDMFLQVGKPVKKPRVRASKKNVAPVFTLSLEFFEQFGVLGLSPPTSIEGVQKSVEELHAKKEWFSEQPRGSVPSASDIRKANLKEAQKPVKSTKKNGKIDISSSDFAPLSAGSSTAAMNATWGQKSADVAVESATEATAEIEASA
jgi:uncharacterized coiled-coil DUF342 family protein